MKLFCVSCQLELWIYGVFETSTCVDPKSVIRGGKLILLLFFLGPGTSLGTLLCLFKKFESSIKGRGGVHTRVHSLWTVKKITWVPN